MIQRIVLAGAMFTVLACQKADVAPDNVARAYSQALAGGDYAGAARLTHPEALKQLRGLFEPLVEASPEEVGAMLFQVQSKSDFDNLADTLLFSRFINGIFGLRPELGEMMKTATTNVLGHVKGGVDTVFVVAKTEITVEGVAVSQYEVMPMARHEGEWRALMKADFANMAQAMRQMIRD